MNNTHMVYTQSHEWLCPQGDYWLFGITAFAAAHLGEIVFIEMPRSNLAPSMHIKSNE